MVKVYSLLIISRNHSNTFIALPAEIESKILQQGLLVMISGKNDTHARVY